MFKVNTDGTGFNVVESFNGVNNEANPWAGVVLSGNTLYGASGGPGTTTGTLFAVNTNGTGFTTLHSFTELSGRFYTNSDGAFVTNGGPILSDNTLYGTAESGGTWGSGTVFALNTDGTGFTTLHSFAATSVPVDPYYGAESPPYTNTDGVWPDVGLMLSGNTLYGETVWGGSSGWGTVFAINTNGTGFTTLHSFTGGSDGAWPYLGPLILSGNTLYGTASRGGSGGGNSGYGTMFSINTDGTGFTTLHIFTATSGPLNTNSDGGLPSGGLILSGNTLHGTAESGGSSGYGTVFAVNTNGTGFTTLHSFTGRTDGAYPLAGVILSGNTLYGAASGGIFPVNGTVFSLSLPMAPPQLAIIPSGTNVVLTWATNATGFTLQSATNLASPTVWAAVSPGPVVVNGLKAVTNPISGAQQFYRLSQ